jgi:hypothetical protein
LIVGHEDTLEAVEDVEEEKQLMALPVASVEKEGELFADEAWVGVAVLREAVEAEDEAWVGVDEAIDIEATVVEEVVMIRVISPMIFKTWVGCMLVVISDLVVRWMLVSCGSSTVGMLARKVWRGVRVNK